MKKVSHLILLPVVSIIIPFMQKTHVFTVSSFTQAKALDFPGLPEHISSLDPKCDLGMLTSRYTFLGQGKVLVS
jgi:hypothetical protein